MAKLNDSVNYTDEDLDQLLDFDAIQSAREIVGAKNDEADALGMLLHMGHSENKKIALQECSDTYWSCPIEIGIECAEKMGFELLNAVLMPEHENKHCQGFKRTFYVYYSPKRNAILLMNDFKLGELPPALNRADLFYEATELFHGCYKNTPRGSSRPAGKYEPNKKFSWAGQADLREGFKHKIRKLDGLVDYHKPWVNDIQSQWMTFPQDRDRDWNEWYKLSKEEVDQEKIENIRKWMGLERYPEYAQALNFNLNGEEDDVQ